jgi:tetratricopeptide (TPR) repeat protein
MGKASRRKRKPLEGKGIKRPVPEKKGIQSVHSGSYAPAVVFFFIIWRDDVTLWEDMVEKSPRKERGQYNLGNAYFDLGRTDEAINEYRKAINLNHNYPRAHNNLALAYAEEGQFDKAIQEYKIALKLRPDFATAHNNLGTAYLKQKRLNEAIEEYLLAIGLKPNYANAHYNLGIAYTIKGSKEEARGEFEEVLKLDPQAEMARKILQSLSK